MPANLGQMALNNRSSRPSELACDAQNLGHSRLHAVGFPYPPYTDFPLKEITLYACWDGDHWVTMLPSEY